MLSFLLGAGASFEAGLPLAAGLTKAIIDGAPPSHRPLLEFARAAIEAQRAGRRQESLREDGELEVDSEALFNAVDDLVHRDKLDIAPFVASWHPLLASMEAPAAPPRLKEIERALHKALREPDRRFGRSNVQELAEVLHRGFGGRTAQLEPVLDAMAHSVLRSVSMNEPDRVRYLGPIAALASTVEGGVMVCSLNYDSTIETVSDTLGVDWSDGITEDVGSRVLDFGATRLRLVKLHGSASWRKSENGNVTRITRDEERGFHNRAVKFGGRNKLTADWPYMQLFWYWHEQLQLCRTLCVVGYSFRDDHVNSVVRSWMDQSAANRVIVVDPGHRHSSSHPLGEHLRYNSNLSRGHWVEDPTGHGGRKSKDGPPPNPRVIILPTAAGEALAHISEFI